MKRIWIVGASTGIGFELVKILLKNNYKVIASSRTCESNNALIKLKEQYSSKLTLYNLNVCFCPSMEEDIKKIFNTYDGLDYWFYNAGAYEPMHLDDLNIGSIVKMNETNYLGVLKIVKYLYPYFKTQKSGKWIWNISLSSIFGLPNGGGYSAPKAALLNFAQSIEPQLKDENIKLQIINHGFVKTKLTKKNSFPMPQLMEAKYTANKIFENIDSDKFEIYFPFLLSKFLKLLSVLPYSISLWITRKITK